MLNCTGKFGIRVFILTGLLFFLPSTGAAGVTRVCVMSQVDRPTEDLPTSPKAMSFFANQITELIGGESYLAVAYFTPEFGEECTSLRPDSKSISATCWTACHHDCSTRHGSILVTQSSFCILTDRGDHLRSLVTFSVLSKDMYRTPASLFHWGWLACKRQVGPSGKPIFS